MDNNRAIFHVKISEIDQIAKKPSKYFVRITGKLDSYNPTTKQAILSSFEDDNQYEIIVNLLLVENFNQQDFHSKHDILQFIGNVVETDGMIQFKAIFYRIIKRIKLKEYYQAIDFQRSYLREKGYMRKDDIFLL